MSADPNLELQQSRTGKPDSKRAHRASRNRPVLVTESGNAEATTETVKEVAASGTSVAVEEMTITEVQPAPRRRPGFFANVSKATPPTDQTEADPKAARLARAMRGKATAPEKPTKEKEKSQAASATRLATTPVRPRPSSGFKMRYIWGMVIYLLVADFLGVYVTNFMTANHLDATLFTWGPIIGKTSTLIFLGILIVILIVMARFDLLPRSFAAMANSNNTTSQRTNLTRSKGEPTFETRSAQPSLKQGVQGESDDLYREYRENQRYFQRRDRKR